MIQSSSAFDVVNSVYGRFLIDDRSQWDAYHNTYGGESIIGSAENGCFIF